MDVNDGHSRDTAIPFGTQIVGGATGLGIRQARRQFPKTCRNSTEQVGVNRLSSTCLGSFFPSKLSISFPCANEHFAQC